MVNLSDLTVGQKVYFIDETNARVHRRTKRWWRVRAVRFRGRQGDGFCRLRVGRWEHVFYDSAVERHAFLVKKEAVIECQNLNRPDYPENPD